MNLIELRRDIDEEVSVILSGEFSIDVVETSIVPHSGDGAITFPNIDNKIQGTKLLETTVPYIDMRRSTELSLRHRRHTVAKLYSAFVRAMTRCAAQFDGEVRGIIGDRVMVLFQPKNCFENAIDTAVLMNSVCQKIINPRFAHNDVKFGIGIDYGQMLATKTGIRRHGEAQQSYRSLVWLGRPANVASKLTDNANKPEDSSDLALLQVAYNRFGQLYYQEEWPHNFVQQFTHDPVSGLMRHYDPAFHSFTSYKKKIIQRAATPPILMTKRVYDGFEAAKGNAIELQNKWLTERDVQIREYRDKVYGMDVSYTAFG
jgi:adenylate cyclase